MNSWSSRDLGLARKGWEQGVWWAEGCQGEAERNALARGWVRWRLRLGGAGCMGRPGCGHSFFSVHGGLASWAARQEVAITSSYNEGAKTCSPPVCKCCRRKALERESSWSLWCGCLGKYPFYRGPHICCGLVWTFVSGDSGKPLTFIRVEPRAGSFLV